MCGVAAQPANAKLKSVPEKIAKTDFQDFCGFRFCGPLCASFLDMEFTATRNCGRVLSGVTFLWFSRPVKQIMFMIA